MASVCAWKTNKELRRKHNVNQIAFAEDDSSPYEPRILFVPLTDFKSTAVASKAVDALGAPYNINPSYNTTKNLGYYSKDARENIDCLYLLDLHPERNFKFEYESFSRGYYSM
jgi:hypothetical protein